MPEGPESIASSNYSAYANQETGFHEESEEVERQQGCMKCYKKGNMLIMCECTVEQDDFLPGFPSERTKVRWVIGPYWHMLIMTYGVIITITLLVYDTVIPKRDTLEVKFGLAISGLTLLFLSLTAFSDPGIFPKHTRPKGPNWSYSGQAQSFRPPNVIYCRECKLLIESYDHFCPWSGTVIGLKNLKFFHCFVSCLILTMIYDTVLLILALSSPAGSGSSTTTSSSSVFLGPLRGFLFSSHSY